MSQKKAYTITDLGPGDGGKGTAVHAVSCKVKPHTIIKVGGGQGSHGVKTAAGESFSFSHFGSGTFEGVETYICDQFVLSPVGVVNEINALKYQHGIRNVSDLLMIDENALCATPFHGIVSRLSEMKRKKCARGTVGTGIGTAYAFASMYPDTVIRAKDLGLKSARSRLVQVREIVMAQYVSSLTPDEFLVEDWEDVQFEIDRLKDVGFLDWTLEQFAELSESVRIVPSETLGEILKRDGNVIFESSHGVLTDRAYGFLPHTSKLRTLPQETSWEVLDRYGYDGQIIRLGVTRAYQFRHGAGPLTGASDENIDHLVPSELRDENRYQGKVRAGPMDLVLLRYALACCGGSQVFDGLIITWADSIQKNGSWQLYKRYRDAVDGRFFNKDADIRAFDGQPDKHDEYQKALTGEIKRCTAALSTVTIQPEATQDEISKVVCDTLERELGVKTKIVSFGPTEQDKIYL